MIMIVRSIIVLLLLLIIIIMIILIVIIVILIRRRHGGPGERPVGVAPGAPVEVGAPDVDARGAHVHRRGAYKL